MSIKNRRTFFILKATRKRPSEDGLRRVLYSLKSVSSALKANSTILNNSTHTKKKKETTKTVKEKMKLRETGVYKICTR